MWSLTIIGNRKYFVDLKIQMRQSKIEIYIHFVWTTKNREHLLDSKEIERRIYRCISAKAAKMECDVLAIGGMPDHVHILLKVPANLSAAEIAKSLKGASSTLARKSIMPHHSFDWQDGYGAFSVSKSHLTKVTNYVLNQPHHHATGDLWPALEQTDEQL